METYWKDGNNNIWYLCPGHKPLSRSPQETESFEGAFGSNSRAVYATTGAVIATLPRDLILDEALAAARMLILAHRRD